MKAKNLNLVLALIALTAVPLSAVETGATCTTVEDCPYLHTCEKNICTHKELFPITFREVGGTILILFLNAIMTAGGVGGGAAYVPYIMLIFQYNLKQSIFIAYACVFGGGIGNLVNIITLKNPKTRRYMINFNINMIILPALMIGVLIGVLLTRMFPPFITNLLLLFVLAFSTYKNFFKLKANLIKERKDKKAKKEANLKELATKEELTPHLQAQPVPVSEEKNDTLPEQKEKDDEVSSRTGPKISMEIAVAGNKIAPHNEDIVPKEKGTKTHEATPQDDKIKRRDIIIQRELRFPFHKIRELMINVVIIVLIGIIRGSKTFDPVVGVQWTCGWDFLWFALAIFFFLLNLARSTYLVLKWQREKIEVGYEFLPEEPILDKMRTFKLIIGSIIAGIIGAIVALGGAIIISPLLLDMSIPPAFSAATTGVFMVFSMFNAMFQTILDGNLSWQKLVWFLPLAFAFSFISSKIVNWYVKKTAKQSTVILSVMIGVIMGFLCLIVLFIKSLVENFQEQINFKSIC